MSSKNKNKKRAVSKIEKPSKDEASTDHSTPPEHLDTPDDTEVERTVRKSTRTSVIVRQAERDAIRAALQATMKVSPEYLRHLLCRMKTQPLFARVVWAFMKAVSWLNRMMLWWSGNSYFGYGSYILQLLVYFFLLSMTIHFNLDPYCILRDEMNGKKKKKKYTHTQEKMKNIKQSLRVLISFF